MAHAKGRYGKSVPADRENEKGEDGEDRSAPKGSAEAELTSGRYVDFPEFASELLRIQTKAGTFESLVLNLPQRIRWELISGIQAAGEPVRVWEAKARQTGCSTFVQGYCFHQCVTQFDETALFVAHTDKTVHEVFTKCKLFYEHLPKSLQPKRKYDNRTALDFRSPRGAEGLRSRLNVVLPRGATSANGITARKVHVSEIALYNNPREFMLNMLQSVPDTPDSFVYVESTCEGGGDYHHEMYSNGRVFGGDIPPWMPLKEKYPGDENSQWYVIFTPWFLMTEYRKSLRCSEEDFRKTLAPDEQDLLDRFGDYVSLEALQWRRETIMTKCGGDQAGFRQQYPSTDEEAFGSTGRLVFDKNDMDYQEKAFVCACDICAPYVGFDPGEFHSCPEHKWYEIVDSSQWSPDKYERMWTTYKPELIEAMPGVGRFSVWKHPEPRRRYLVAADVAAGHDDGDWDSVTVVDEVTLEQVAAWRGKVDQVQYADVLLLISIYYNRAILAPEATGAGHGLIAMLYHTRYYNLYRRKVVNQVGNSPTALLGWSTTSSSKNAAIGLAIKAFREKYIKIRSRNAFEELRALRAATVTADSEGTRMLKISAPSGMHDDDAMSAIIACAITHYIGRLNQRPAEDEPNPWDASTWTEEMWEIAGQEAEDLNAAASGYIQQ